MYEIVGGGVSLLIEMGIFFYKSNESSALQLIDKLLRRSPLRVV
jgi:hypothetical protein